MGTLFSTQRDLDLLAMPVGSTAYVSFTIRFPSNKPKAKNNLLRFGGFPGQELSGPVTVIRRAADTWTIEAVEPSIGVLLEGNEKPGKDGLFTETGRGPLPFLITIECQVPSQCGP